MATEAEALLAGTGWLPEPPRTPGRSVIDLVAVTNGMDLSSEPQGEETAAAGNEPVMEEAVSSDEGEATELDVQAVAAE